MRVFVLLVAVGLFGGGCYTRTIRVPGVVDLRSTGADLVTDASVEPKPRTGVASWLAGDGRVVDGSTVRLQDRRWWALGSVSVYDPGLNIGWHSLATKERAFCDVSIRESVTSTDVTLYILSKAVPVVNVLAWTTPTFTGEVTFRPCMLEGT